MRLIRSRTCRREKRGGERGAVVVEFALIAPVLFLVAAAIIDFGMTFTDYIQVRGGTGQAARQGAVANFGSSCTLNSVSVAPSANIQKLMCTTKSRIGVDPSRVYTKVVFSPSGSSNYQIGNGMVVCAQTPMTSLTGLTSPFLQSKYLKTKVHVSIEQVSSVAEAEGEEAAPAGTTWSWCS